MSYRQRIEKPLAQRIARRVRARRLKLGLTQKQAALLAKIHLRQWQKVEAADLNMTLQTLVRLGLALGVDPAELLTP